jgi:hypothetical protein
MPLFRALREAEIKAGNILLPKSQAPFLAHPRLPLVLPFTLGEREEHAVREHQWDSKYPTRGISCTSEWAVAQRYASTSKVIVTISEELCEAHSIRRYRVRDHVPLQLIEHPEDAEIILVSSVDGPLPPDIITAVTRV